jgi:proliferating cell nuclear antigen
VNLIYLYIEIYNNLGKILFELPDEVEIALRRKVSATHGAHRGGLSSSITQAIVEWLDKGTEVPKERLPNTEQRMEEQPPRENCSFEIRTSNPRIILNAINAANVIVDEATFEVTKDGLRFRAMDPAHIALLDITIAKDDLDFFSLSEETAIRICVRIDELKRMLKQMKYGKLEIYLPKNDSLLSIENGNLKRMPRLIQPTASSSPLPNLKLDAWMKFNRIFINQLINFRDLEFFTFAAKDNTFMIQSKQQSERYDFEAKFSSSDGKLVDMKAMPVERKATFSSDYIVKFLSSLTEPEEIEISFSSKMPCKFTFQLAKASKIDFYLAPRVYD